MASRDFRPPEEKTSPVLFFVLGIVLVAVTFWTVWDETVSRRPWKDFQKSFNDFERKLTENELARARKKSASKIGPIISRVKELESKLAGDGGIAKLQDELERLKLTAFEKVQDFAFSKAIFDQTYFEMNEGIRQGHDVSAEKKHVEEIQKEIALKKPLAEKAEASRDAVIAKIQAKYKPLNDLKKQQGEIDKDALDLERRLDSIGKRKYEIKQIVLREFDRNNFGEPVAFVVGSSQSGGRGVWIISRGDTPGIRLAGDENELRAPSTTEEKYTNCGQFDQTSRPHFRRPFLAHTTGGGRHAKQNALLLPAMQNAPAWERR